MSPEDAPLVEYVETVEEARTQFEECECPIHYFVLLMAQRLLRERAMRD